MQIARGHQLRTPMKNSPLQYVFTYVLEGSDGVTLIDPGYGIPDAWDSLTAALSDLGYRPSDVARVLISHGHADHAGMVGWIRRQAPTVEVGMMACEWPWMLERERREQATSPAAQETWDRLLDDWFVQHGLSQNEVATGRREHAGSTGGAPFSHVPPSEIPMVDPPTLMLNDGNRLTFGEWSLEVVWTPGHTPGHMCLYEVNRRIMFTGDHVLPRITPNVSIHLGQEGTNPLDDFLASLEKVAGYEVSLALPAHQFLIQDLPARCRELQAHHRERLAEVERAVSAARLATTRDVAAAIHWNAGDFAELALPTKRSALGETLSHLEALRVSGRIRRVEAERALWEAVGEAIGVAEANEPEAAEGLGG